MILALPASILVRTSTKVFSHVNSYFEHYQPTGILEPGISPQDGVFNSTQNPHDHRGIGAGLLPPEEFQVQTMISSHVTAEYLRFLEHPNLRQMVRDLTGWEKEVLLRRTMLRHNIPGGLSTGIHYDKLFLRDGGAYFLTAWVPIGKSMHDENNSETDHG